MPVPAAASIAVGSSRWALTEWVARGDTLLITAPTGVGKTWLTCTLAQHASQRGQSALYLRVTRLADELKFLQGSGGFGRWLIGLAKTEVLVLDDWGVCALNAGTRADLLRIIDDRAASKTTIITTQLPVNHWHGWIADVTIAVEVFAAGREPPAFGSPSRA